MYTPRSGAVPKGNIGLEVIREEDLPEESRQEVIETSKLIQAEAAQMIIQSSNDSTMGAMAKIAETARQCESEAKRRKKDKPDVPVPTCTRISDEDYDRLYPKTFTGMPRFLIRTAPDADSDEEGSDESEYDLDSEDEAWLRTHKEFKITPSRLEFIFGKLNDLNTRDYKVARRELDEVYHEDLSNIFTYWKRKYFPKQNTGSKKPKLEVLPEKPLEAAPLPKKVPMTVLETEALEETYRRALKCKYKLLRLKTMAEQLTGVAEPSSTLELEVFDGFERMMAKMKEECNTVTVPAQNVTPNNAIDVVVGDDTDFNIPNGCQLRLAPGLTVNCSFEEPKSYPSVQEVTNDDVVAGKSQGPGENSVAKEK